MNQQYDGIFVIFGVTGDLAKRKLLPALYQLAQDNLLSESFSIIGTTRRSTTVDDIIENIRQGVTESGDTINETVLTKLRHCISLVHMNIGEAEEYGRLTSAIDHIEATHGATNRLFYLAVPPEMFDNIILGLSRVGLNQPKEDADSRLLIEKPFGLDEVTARELIEKIREHFDEQQVYRVDHYLAKETAQNILRFRFDNPLIQGVWEQGDIDHIMITAAENIGIEGRVNFYERIGALRDLIQSHLIQLLALVTMDQPVDRSAEALHDAKLKLLESIVPISPEHVGSYTARGQYDTYKQEVDNPETLTETYAAIRLDIDNERWRGIPVLLRAGKALATKTTEISFVFRTHDTSDYKNVLTIKIQPNEGIILHLLAKKPSLNDEVEMVAMNFFYKDYFNIRQPDAYERVLIDAIRGDKTLFTTDKEVLTSWRIIQAVIDKWSIDDQGLETYPTGSWGPTSAAHLAHSVNASWLTEKLHAPTE